MVKINAKKRIFIIMFRIIQKFIEIVREISEEINWRNIDGVLFEGMDICRKDRVQ